MKSDIEEFSKYNLQIDDMMKNGDYQVAFDVFKRFLQRIDERVRDNL